MDLVLFYFSFLLCSFILFLSSFFLYLDIDEEDKM